MKNSELEQLINEKLNSATFSDYAPNGLQVEGRETVQKIVTGVTASQALLDEAVRLQADAVIVHHGYFWKGESPVIRGIKRQRLKTLLPLRRVLLVLTRFQTVEHLLHPFKTEKRPANHQQWRNGPGYKGANEKRQRNKDHLVNKGPFRYAPHHRQLTVRPHAADLLRVKRQVIPQYPGGFFRCQFPHD